MRISQRVSLITHEAWRKLNKMLNRLLPTLTQEHFEKSLETLYKEWMLVVTEVVDFGHFQPPL
jgi:adenylate cyclase